jgi:GT2 family glycosyltransferase
MIKPAVSIVILTHNKLACTRRCMSSLLQTRSVPWELIVVDNGSTDGTRGWLEAFGDEARRAGVAMTLIANDDNIGCSTARNQGLARAAADRVAFLDNDVALRQRSWLDRLVRALDEQPAAALVGPKLVYPFAPHDIQCAGAAVTPTGRVQFLGRGERRDDPRFNRARTVQCLISACCLGRKEALNEVGGFDEAYNPVEFEDIDLCYKMRQQGRIVLYEPNAEVYHFESVTTAGTPSLPNTALIVRHGLLFQRRWRHMFANENGPDEAAARWRRLAAVPFEQIGEPPVYDDLPEPDADGKSRDNPSPAGTEHGAAGIGPGAARIQSEKHKERRQR